MKHQLVTGVFQRWLEEAKELARRRERVLAQAVARFLNQEVAHAFGIWAADGARHAHAKELKRKVVVRLVQGLLADVFYAWTECVGAQAARHAEVRHLGCNRRDGGVEVD